MTYLELVQAAISDSGFGIGSQLTNFDAPTHRQSLFIGFVRQAWLKIQQSKRWKFNRHTFECALTENVREYAPSAMRDAAGAPSIPAFPNPDGSPFLDGQNRPVAASGVRQWLLKDTDDNPAWALTDLGTPGPAGPTVYGGAIQYLDHATFRRRYLNRPASAIPTGKPSAFTQLDRAPKSILVHPTPNATGRYLLYGACQRESQVLRFATDVPFGLPEEYHDLIKWLAIMLRASESEDIESLQMAKAQYDEIRRDAAGDLTIAWTLAAGFGSRSDSSGVRSFADL